MGRVAVVTGAASGMGLAIARHLAARGNRIGLIDLNGEAALRAAEDLRSTGATAIGAQADVTDRGTVDAALDKVRAELGPIQIMVTSAGLDAFEKFADITLESWCNGLHMSLRVARRLAAQGVAARVLDLRWLAPLPVADILLAAGTTGRVLVVDETRRTGGVSEGVLAALVDAGFDGRVARVASKDSFVPLGDAARLVLVSEGEIEEAALRLVS